MLVHNVDGLMGWCLCCAARDVWNPLALLNVPTINTDRGMRAINHCYVKYGMYAHRKRMEIGCVVWFRLFVSFRAWVYLWFPTDIREEIANTKSRYDRRAFDCVPDYIYCRWSHASLYSNTDERVENVAVGALFIHSISDTLFHVNIHPSSGYDVRFEWTWLTEYVPVPVVVVAAYTWTTSVLRAHIESTNNQAIKQRRQWDMETGGGKRRDWIQSFEDVARHTENIHMFRYVRAGVCVAYSTRFWCYQSQMTAEPGCTKYT